MKKAAAEPCAACWRDLPHCGCVVERADAETLMFWHRTTDDAAEAILSAGFRDNSGRILAGVAEDFTGVFVSNVPLDSSEGARGDVLLELKVRASEAELAEYEVVEEGKPYREWLVPAELLNTRASIRRAEQERGRSMKKQAARRSARATKSADTPARATPFRIELAASDEQRIPLASLRRDGELICRARGVNQDAVLEYSAAMSAGATFPPIVVFVDADGVHWLADGFHRTAAAELAGLTELVADVREGGRQEALLHAAKANATHGLRRTNADKRRAVELVLAAFADWSDRRIAEACGVDHKSVAVLRTPSSGEVPQLRLGADGRARKLPAVTPKDGSAAEAQASRRTKFIPDVVARNAVRGIDDALDAWPPNTDYRPLIAEMDWKMHHVLALQRKLTGAEPVEEVGLMRGEPEVAVPHAAGNRDAVESEP